MYQLPLTTWEKNVIELALDNLRKEWEKDGDCPNAVKMIEELRLGLTVHCKARNAKVASDKVRGDLTFAEATRNGAG